MVVADPKSKDGIENKTLIIDADAHVVETEHTWDFMDTNELKFRPQLQSAPNNPDQKFWMIGGQRRGFRFNQLSSQQWKERDERTGRRTELPEEAREADDVNLRLQVMDETGIDVQICHNTLWIEHVADDPELDVALARSWNRWVAEAWKRAPERIRWSSVVPTLNLEQAIKQAAYAKENGAVAICLRPVEGNRIVTDPYFYPLFEAAQDLDMAIAIHIANGNPDNVKLWVGAAGGLAAFRAPTVMACASLLTAPIIERFPKLRWGFIEAAASWMPWLDSEMAQRSGRRAHGEENFNVFAERNIYVTCQNEDDIRYLIDQGFLSALVIGTDFGHFDASSDVDAITKFQENKKLTDAEKADILTNNPRRLYSI